MIGFHMLQRLLDRDAEMLPHGDLGLDGLDDLPEDEGSHVEEDVIDLDESGRRPRTCTSSDRLLRNHALLCGIRSRLAFGRTLAFGAGAARSVFPGETSFPRPPVPRSTCPCEHYRPC